MRFMTLLDHVGYGYRWRPCIPRKLDGYNNFYTISYRNTVLLHFMYIKSSQYLTNLISMDWILRIRRHVKILSDIYIMGWKNYSLKKGGTTLALIVVHSLLLHNISTNCQWRIVINTGYYRKRDHKVMMSKYMPPPTLLFKFVLRWEHQQQMTNLVVCHIMIRII